MIELSRVSQNKCVRRLWLFPRLIVDCLRLEKVEAPTIRFLLTTTNNWLFIMFTNYQFVVSNVVTKLLHQFGYLFLLKMFSLWIRRWFIYAKRWGWISSLVHFTIIGMIFHCDWTITAWQGQDMAHWTPSKSHTYEGAGQFCGRLIFSFFLNSHLFFDPFPNWVFSVFALRKMENYWPTNTD